MTTATEPALQAKTISPSLTVNDLQLEVLVIDRVERPTEN